MPNMLEQKINENEELYNSTKAELEKIIGAANSEYNALLKDFNQQMSYIQRDSTLSKEGKIKKATEVRQSFIDKVNSKSLDYFDSLQKQLDIALKEDEIRKLKNLEGLNSDMLPQLIYVNSMLASISSLTDADLLKDVFEYASEECNFSNELINMIYIKSRSLISNATPVENSENDNNNRLNAMKLGGDRVKINTIVDKINQYKKNYSDDFNQLKKSFSMAFNQHKYPISLYIQRDPKIDFVVPVNLQSNLWNSSNKVNDPWSKY